MKNEIYAIECDLFPKNKIIEILKFNNFYFLSSGAKPEVGKGKYLSFNEDKMWFVNKVVVLNRDASTIIIGNTYREDMPESAFEVYFPNQSKTVGFNYNPEFSKNLVSMENFKLNSASPIISVNLNNKNIDKIISGKDITFSNVQTRESKIFRPVSFIEARSNGIEKLFLYKKKDFYIVIGHILQGKKQRNNVVYNKAFTELIMGIKGIDLETAKEPKEKRNIKRSNDTDSLVQGTEYRQNGDYGFNYNPDPEDDILINSLKSNNRSKLKKKKTIPYNFEDRSVLWIDNRPNIDRINMILEKISSFGILSISIKEVAYLKGLP